MFVLYWRFLATITIKLRNNMKQIALYIYILAAISLSLGSCSYAPQQELTQFVDVEDEIEVNILKNLFETDAFLLSVKTLKSDLCAESTFITSFQTSDEKIVLNIDGLEIPSDCSNFDSQATNVEEFDFTEKSKLIEINVAKNLSNNIYLEQFDGHISFVHNNLRGIVFEQSQLHDIKNNYLWGGIYSTSVKDIKLFTDFVELIEETAAFKSLEIGNYGHFTIENEEVAAIDPYNLNRANQSFAMEITEENPILETEIPALILEFKMNNPQLDLFFVSGNGMVY